MYATGSLGGSARDASTVLLLRDRAGGGFEVLLVRRHARSGFMGGAFVFPGGKLDPGDADAALLARASGHERAAARLAPTPGRTLELTTGAALHIAAIRETFEEAGVLLARDSTGAPLAFEDPASIERFADHRRRLDRAEATLASILEAENLALDLDALAPWAHWVTPSTEPKRFDTRFFLARHPPGQTPRIDRRETTEEAWLSPTEALAAHEAGKIVLPAPTWLTLEELAGFAGAEDAFGAARGRTIVAVLPKVIALDGSFAVLMPWDPSYASAEGESLPIGGPHPMARLASRIVLEGDRWVARGS